MCSWEGGGGGGGGEIEGVGYRGEFGYTIVLISTLTPEFQLGLGTLLY